MLTVSRTNSSLLPHHQTFLDRVITHLSNDGRFAGLAMSGSGSVNKLDEFSDIDLVVAIKPPFVTEVTAERHQLAQQFGQLLSSFTGEHVGEPRLLICLYQETELLHVDFKFVALPDVGQRVDNPVILWQENDALTPFYQGPDGHYPIQPLQWFEDRFWVWVHYGASKTARGEVFEGIEFVSSIRLDVIGPLAAKLNGQEPVGVRRLEQNLPDIAKQLETTVTSYSAVAVFNAIESLASIYIALRDQLSLQEPIILRDEARIQSLQYLESMKERASEE